MMDRLYLYSLARARPGQPGRRLPAALIMVPIDARVVLHCVLCSFTLSLPGRTPALLGSARKPLPALKVGARWWRAAESAPLLAARSARRTLGGHARIRLASLPAWRRSRSQLACQRARLSVRKVSLRTG